MKPPTVDESLRCLDNIIPQIALVLLKRTGNMTLNRLPVVPNEI